MKQKTMILGAVLLALSGLAFAGFAEHRPVLFYNPTDSAPIGFWLLDDDAEPALGDWVMAEIPERFRDFVLARRYVPDGVPLLKRVVAMAGDHVCARGNSIFVNGIAMANIPTRDSLHRVLQGWRGCQVLQAHQFMLLNAHPISLDSRLFGPILSTDIMGVAHPIFVCLVAHK